MKFERVMFWVQIHNAPLLCMTRDIGTFLGGLIGDMVELDTRLGSECFGKYLRVRVWVDITKPLKRFLRARMASNEPETVMLLKYERLLDFCTHCGCIRHMLRDCLLSPVGYRDAETTSQYGLWLRAASPTKGRGSKFGSSGTSSSLSVLGPIHAVRTRSHDNSVASPPITTRPFSPADDGLHDDFVLNHTNVGSLLMKIQPHAMLQYREAVWMFLPCRDLCITRWLQIAWERGLRSGLSRVRLHWRPRPLLSSK
ncbi:hypothetical protein ACOSQ2_004511 [Xanthoceras sorbifolium]